MQKPKTPLVVIILATLLTAVFTAILIIPICFGCSYFLGLLPEYHRETFYFSLAWCLALAVGVAYGQERAK
jgi:ABC-type phosphate transport system permease subunit